jgi:hypothetical protein
LSDFNIKPQNADQSRQKSLYFLLQSRARVLSLNRDIDAATKLQLRAFSKSLVVSPGEERTWIIEHVTPTGTREERIISRSLFKFYQQGGVKANGESDGTFENNMGQADQLIRDWVSNVPLDTSSPPDGTSERYHWETRVSSLYPLASLFALSSQNVVGLVGAATILALYFFSTLRSSPLVRKLVALCVVSATAIISFSAVCSIQETPSAEGTLVAQVALVLSSVLIFQTSVDKRMILFSRGLIFPVILLSFQMAELWSLGVIMSATTALVTSKRAKPLSEILLAVVIGACSVVVFLWSGEAASLGSIWQIVAGIVVFAGISVFVVFFGNLSFWLRIVWGATWVLSSYAVIFSS